MAYTTINDPSAYFQTVLYTGNGGTQSITNTGNSDLQPNWIWTKVRSEAGSHRLVDTVRGLAKPMFSNGADADADETNYSAFDSDGFSLVNESLNESSRTYVAWQWKAGTSFSNDASSTSVGSIDSTGSVNTDAGFSIISYAGTGSAATVAHGLGVAPAWILLKDRDSASHDWFNYHQSLGNGKYMRTNSTDGEATASTIWNDTSPTTSVFSIGTNENMSTSGNNFIAYCFAEKKGYSKFGKYTGNGDANGPFVHTGFRPSWIMMKQTGNSKNWVMSDLARSDVPNGNVNDQVVYANLNNSEESSSGLSIDIVSNGFKIRGNGGDRNIDGSTYIYMCFANNPFVTSTSIPATAG